MQYIKLKITHEGQDIEFYQCILNGSVVEHRTDPNGDLFEIPEGCGGGDVIDANPPFPAWGVADEPPPPPEPEPLLKQHEIDAIYVLKDLINSGRLEIAIAALGSVTV
jgi:hypothetical protein